MRKLLFAPVIAVISLTTSPLWAADAKVRSAQEALTALGFYIGAADGELNPETKGALRRFQIYKGLSASGTLDAATQTALEEGNDASASAPEPARPPGPTQSVQESDQEFLEREKPVAPPVAPPAPAPERSLSAEDATIFKEWYRDTPYQNAPPVVQRETLQKAQMLLKQRRLYDGEGSADGLPGPETEEALFRYQSSRGLRLTGRLDFDTLASLRLLPGRGPVSPGSPSNPGPRPTKKQHEERPDAPAIPRGPGAVRGIPLD